MASNMFEDLVPAKGTEASPPGNMFEGFVPKKAEPEPEPTSLRDRALNSLPPELREYAQKALSVLASDDQRNAPSYSPYKPADPNNMPNDAINRVGTDAQMVGATAAAGLGAAGARMLPQAAPNLPRVTMPNMPTQMATPGTGAMPINPPPLPAGAVQTAGNAAQAGLLGQVAKSMGGAAAGGIAHTAVEHLPPPFNTLGHMGLKMMNF